MKKKNSTNEPMQNNKVEENTSSETVQNNEIKDNNELPKEQEVKLESGASAHQEEQKDPLEESNNLIQKLQNENKELIEKIKYSQAELVAYRMRKDEETASILKYANKDLITEIIPLVDNFESALQLASKNDNPEFAKYLTGFQMMYTNLLSILNKFGVEVINRAGQPFNPNEEQALVAENNPELEDEIVIEVLQKGYKLKDRVIRPASVKINQK